MNKQAEQYAADMAPMRVAQTEAQAISSARTQYRAAFRTMAASGERFHILAGSAGVLLAAESAAIYRPMQRLVSDVHAMAEQTMVNALTVALRNRQTP